MNWNQALKHYGLGTIIALGLTYLMATRFADAQDVQAKEIVKLRDLVTSHVSDSNHLLFQICVNTSDTAQKLAGCQQALGR